MGIFFGILFAVAVFSFILMLIPYPFSIWAMMVLGFSIVFTMLYHILEKLDEKK